MKLFIDSADPEEIGRLAAIGIFAGVTTNPVILAAARTTPEALAAALAAREVPGDVFFQAAGGEPGALVASAARLSRLLPGRVVVKVPSTPAGFAAMALLAREGVRTAATALFTAGQGIAAAEAGADVIIPFYGRLEKSGGDAPGLLRDLGLLQGRETRKPKLLAASLKAAGQVVECLRACAWGVTVSPALARELLASPLTDAAVLKFDAAASHEEE